MIDEASAIDRPALWAASALIVGSAIAVDPGGAFPFGPLRWMVISTGALAVVALVIRRGTLRIHRPSVLGWGVYILWGAVVALWAVDPLYNWIGTPDRHLGLATFVLFAGLFVAGSQFADEGSVRTVVKAAVVAAIAIGLYTILEVAGRAPVDVATPSGRPGGPYGTAAYLGAATALLLPVVVGAIADGLGSRQWRVGAVAAAGAVGFAALASQTRAGWVGLVAAAIISLPANWDWLRRHRTAAVAGLATLAVVVAVSPVGDRVTAAFDFDDGTARGRIDEWQVGAAVVLAHPIGVGFEGYRIAFAEGVDADYERRYTRQTMPDRAHNGPLDVGASTGLPGMFVYILAIGFLVRRCWRAVRRGTPWLAGIAAGVTGYAAQQFFLFPISEFDPVFWLFAGIVVAATSPHTLVTVRIPRWAWILPMVLAVASSAAGLLDVAADRRLATGLERLAAGDVDAAVEATADAAALRPDSIRYLLAAGVASAETGAAGGYGGAVARLEEALAISPGDPILRAEHASFLLRQAQVARDPALRRAATAEWQQLVDDDPVHARYRLELGNAYALAGETRLAENEWLIAADLAPTSTAPLVNLATIYLESGRIDEARRAAKQAQSIDPDAVEVTRLIELLER